jgi:hypothetical protein
MSRDKQIDEMVEFMTEGVRPWAEDAEALYNAGYRKASDLVDNIFNEIATAIAEAKEEASKFEYECFETLLIKKVENIRKKYTEGANESHIS